MPDVTIMESDYHSVASDSGLPKSFRNQTMTVHRRDQDSTAGEPWQLAMFRKGLKTRLRLKALKKLLKPIAPDERCLLLTCGDNRALNYFPAKGTANGLGPISKITRLGPP